MKNYLLIITLFTLFGTSTVADKVVLLSNHGNAGDHSQALGIDSALKQIKPEKFTTEDIDTKKIKPAEIKKKVDKFLTSEKVVVIGAGEGGIEGIKELQTHPDLVIVLSSHVIRKDFENKQVLNKVNFIALPSHLSEEAFALGEKLIPVIGVSHNRDLCEVKSVYSSNKKELPEANSYLMVMLGGDAPTPDKGIKHFSKEDAEKLAEFVLENAAKEHSTVIVLNGPRTGKYDENDKEIKSAHKDGSLDFVTKHFISKLETQLDPSRIKVFDFQFNNKTPYNSFELVLGALHFKNGILLIPGESTSMISEAVDILPKGKVIIYENGAMNNSHLAHVESERSAGRAYVLKDYKTNLIAGIGTSQSLKTAARVIAEKILQELDKISES